MPKDENPHEQLPLQGFVEQEIGGQLLYSIETLPAKCREVIILHYLENQSIHDIKATIGMSESTVRNRLGYGLFLLKKKMAEKPKNPV